MPQVRAWARRRRCVVPDVPVASATVPLSATPKVFVKQGGKKVADFGTISPVLSPVPHGVAVAARAAEPRPFYYVDPVLPRSVTGGDFRHQHA